MFSLVYKCIIILNIVYNDNGVIMTKFCKKCGNKLEEGSVFCNECGAKCDEKSFSSTNVDLMDDEVEIKRSEIHEACLFAPGIVFGFGLLLGLLSFISVLRYYFVNPFLFFFNIFTIVGLVWLLIRFNAYRHTELVLTNKKVFGKCGLISTVQMQCPLNMVNSVSYSTGLMGKLFGYGTVIISTGSTHFKFRFVRDGQMFYNDIFTQVTIAEKEKIKEQAQAIADALA